MIDPCEALHPGLPEPSMERSRALVERIQAALETAGGAVSLARYMEMALYEPGLGYYERTPRIVGRSGDFATSVSVGSLFGELMAYWIEHEVGASEGLSDGPVEIVEAGAHDGRWAEDILEALMRGPGKDRERFGYRIVEPSATRQAWQRERLARFGDRVAWSEAMPDRVRGVILSNELLDAFPVERWRWSAAQRRWVEQGVSWKNGRFDWIALPTSAPGEWSLPDELQAVLPEGFVRERSPAAVAWWARAAAALENGCLITFDYGLEAEEFLTPGRSAGTLRAYHRHRVSDDLLSSPGEVDLTAHVDFSAVAEAARQQGLTPWYRERQSRFLMRILEATQQSPGSFPDWSTQRVRAFQTLTHPEHFGRSFRVLAQGRGASPWSRA